MAGTVVQTVDYSYHDNNNRIHVLKLACTGDAAAGTVPATVISSATIGYQLVGVETVPGTGGATPSAYTISLANARGLTLLSVPARSTTAKEFYDASVTLGQYPLIVNAVTITVGNLGNSDTADIYLYFIK